jgi:hypothetical protein
MTRLIVAHPGHSFVSAIAMPTADARLSGNFPREFPTSGTSAANLWGKNA